MLIQKLKIQKTKTTMYTTFKTDVITVALVFLIFNFLLTKILREGNVFVEKVPTTANLALLVLNFYKKKLTFIIHT